MAMVKISSPNDWDFGEPNAVLVKLLHGGRLGPHDRHEFVKRAGDASAVFLPRLARLKLADGDVPVHVLALGATEFWGPNRNGDGFKEATCKKHCHTFEKFARHYRSHQNKDPAKSYGFPKFAAYNEAMHRVELLTILNGTKEAAERNGGLVADQEIEKLARGDDLATSMAARVPYDECSYCGNRARTRAEYCTADMCKAGGCKDNLTRLVKMGGDVHFLHVDNPGPDEDGPCWFDDSTVFRPACRTAYGNTADYLTKAAADGEFTVPPAVVIYQDGRNAYSWGPALAGQLKVAAGLDALARRPESGLHPEVRRAFAAAVQPEVDFGRLDAEPGEKTAAALGALADQKIVLPLRDFARLVKQAEHAGAASRRLPGVYGRMIADGSLERRLGQNPYAPGEKLASLRQRHWAEQARPDYSLDPAAVNRRCVLSAVLGRPMPGSKDVFEKSAGDDVAAEGLARAYALYKVAALYRIAETDDDFLTTARFALTQDRTA